METVIARSRSQMWTAFRTPAGDAVLNVADPSHRYGPAISIAIDDVEVDAILDPFASALTVDALLRSGRRLPVPLSTPPLSPGERMAA